MAKILDLTIVEGGLTVRYRVGGDIRSAWLSDTDIAELTAAQIKALAQSRADSDTGADGSGGNRRLDVMPDPIRETRQYFKNNAPQLVIDYFREESPAAKRVLWDAATQAQKLELSFWTSLIAGAWALNEVLD